MAASLGFKDPTYNFLDTLPKDVRLLIYEQVFKDFMLVDREQVTGKHPPVLIGRQNPWAFEMHPLLLTNQTIRDEAEPLFYRRTRFVLIVNPRISEPQLMWLRHMATRGLAVKRLGLRYELPNPHSVPSLFTHLANYGYERLSLPLIPPHCLDPPAFLKHDDKEIFTRREILDVWYDYVDLYEAGVDLSAIAWRDWLRYDWCRASDRTALGTTGKTVGMDLCFARWHRLQRYVNEAFRQGYRLWMHKNAPHGEPSLAFSLTRPAGEGFVDVEEI
ncbi:hypothetical protein MBLNU230_g0612t1 [Neophaeotheca triangularis]